MIKAGQIRKFKNEKLPNIKINHYNENKKLWICIFQEDFKYPYISLKGEMIKDKTEVLEG